MRLHPTNFNKKKSCCICLRVSFFKFAKACLIYGAAGGIMIPLLEKYRQSEIVKDLVNGDFSGLRRSLNDYGDYLSNVMKSSSSSSPTVTASSSEKLLRVDDSAPYLKSSQIYDEHEGTFLRGAKGRKILRNKEFNGVYGNCENADYRLNQTSMVEVEKTSVKFTDTDLVPTKSKDTNAKEEKKVDTKTKSSKNVEKKKTTKSTESTEVTESDSTSSSDNDNVKQSVPSESSWTLDSVSASIISSFVTGAGGLITGKLTGKF